MGLQSTLKTEYGKDLTPKGDAADFNEAIFDGFEAAGFEFEGASGTMKTTGGRIVPHVSNLLPDQFQVMGYESDGPEDWGAFMYGSFNEDFAQIIADSIASGVLILSHEIEGNGTEYYYITPGKVEEIDIVDVILASKGLTR